MSEEPKKESLPAKTESPPKEKKKSELGTLFEGFLEDTGRGLISYFVNEHLIPFAEKTIRSLTDRLLGKMGGSLAPKGQDGSYKKYSKTAGESKVKRRRDPFGLDRMIFNDREEADRLRAALLRRIRTHQVATVAYLYEELNEEYPYTAEFWGWTSMKGADIVLTSEGWQLKLPPVIEIE